MRSPPNLPSDRRVGNWQVIIGVVLAVAMVCKAGSAAAATPALNDQRSAADILEDRPDFAPISAKLLRAIDPVQPPKAAAEGAEGTEGVTFGGGTARFGDSTMTAWRAAMDEAAVPDCLHSEGLKRQPTGFGPLALTGFYALPFIAVAKLRGKCK